MYELTCPKCGAIQTVHDEEESYQQACPRCREVFSWEEYEITKVGKDSASHIPAMPGPDGEELLDLGPCCVCGKEDATVRNVLSLHKRAPVPGTGLGCVVCSLPLDGAIAVLCDDCIRKGQIEPKYAIKGYASDKQRVPVEELTGQFDHIKANHEAYEVVNAGVVEGVGQVIMDSRTAVVGDQIARDDLPYLEGFFKVKFVKKGARISPISKLEYQRLEGQVAEVNVPYRTESAGYCMVAMIMNKRNDEIAILEARQLGEIMADIVKQFGWHFRPPQHEVLQ